MLMNGGRQKFRCRPRERGDPVNTTVGVTLRQFGILGRPVKPGDDGVACGLRRRRRGLLHAVEALHLLGGRGAQPLVGVVAGFEVGAVHAGQVVAHVAHTHAGYSLY
jgi:hypothetical protein